MCFSRALLVIAGVHWHDLCFRFSCALPVWPIGHWCGLSSKGTFRNLRMLPFPFVTPFLRSDRLGV